MKITKENFGELMEKALGRAIKKGYKRKMFYDKILQEVEDYDFIDEKEIINFLVDYLMSVEKICKMIEKGKLKVVDIKATKWCMW